VHLAPRLNPLKSGNLVIVTLSTRHHFLMVCMQTRHLRGVFWQPKMIDLDGDRGRQSFGMRNAHA
jgi:hypothetical protein